MAGKNISKLIPKKIVDKRGISRIVYIKPDINTRVWLKYFPNQLEKKKEYEQLGFISNYPKVKKVDLFIGLDQAKKMILNEKKYTENLIRIAEIRERKIKNRLRKRLKEGQLSYKDIKNIIEQTTQRKNLSPQNIAEIIEYITRK